MCFPLLSNWNPSIFPFFPLYIVQTNAEMPAAQTMQRYIVAPQVEEVRLALRKVKHCAHAVEMRKRHQQRDGFPHHLEAQTNRDTRHMALELSTSQ